MIRRLAVLLLRWERRRLERATRRPYDRAASLALDAVVKALEALGGLGAR